MKKMIFFALASCLFMACGSSESELLSANSHAVAKHDNTMVDTGQQNSVNNNKSPDINKLNHGLSQYWDDSCGKQTIDVLLAFDNTVIETSSLSFVFSYENGKYYLNGAEMDKETWEMLNNAIDEDINKRNAALYLKRTEIVDAIRSMNLMNDEETYKRFLNGYEGLELHDLDVCMLKQLTTLPYLIEIEPYISNMPGI